MGRKARSIAQTFSGWYDGQLAEGYAGASHLVRISCWRVFYSLGTLSVFQPFPVRGWHGAFLGRITGWAMGSTSSFMEFGYFPDIS